ncbi:hypothetical protein ACFXTN_011942 [Malus domestica]
MVFGVELAENEVIWAENLAVWPRSDVFHGFQLEIREDGTWDKPPTTGLVVVDIDALGADDLPELGADLVPALAFLDMENLTHFGEWWRRESEK